MTLRSLRRNAEVRVLEAAAKWRAMLIPNTSTSGAAETRVLVEAVDDLQEINRGGTLGDPHRPPPR